MSNDRFEQDENYQQLHKTYQSESTELPPKSLDDVILQAAHKEVQIDNSSNNVEDIAPAKKTKKQSWYVPASYAAILVLSLSIVMKVSFESDLVTTNSAAPETLSSVSVGKPDSPSKARDNKQAKTKILMERRGYEEAKQRQSQKKSFSSPLPKVKRKKQELSPTMDEPAMSSSGKDMIYAESAAFPASVMKEQSYTVAQSISEEEQVLGAVESNLGIGLSQQAYIDVLVRLLEANQLDKLKTELKLYRKEYPLREGDNGYEDALPKKIQVLEAKWTLKENSKSLQDD